MGFDKDTAIRQCDRCNDVTNVCWCFCQYKPMAVIVYKKSFEDTKGVIRIRITSLYIKLAMVQLHVSWLGDEALDSTHTAILRLPRWTSG